MPIPPFDENGHLPVGIYDCTVEEIEERFGRFQRSDRRIHLFAKLKHYINALKFSGRALELLIDGSFTTAKEEPSDIDLIVGLRPDHNWMSELRPFEYNPISRRRVKQAYRFDLFAFRVDTED